MLQGSAKRCIHYDNGKIHCFYKSKYEERDSEDKTKHESSPGWENNI